MYQFDSKTTNKQERLTNSEQRKDFGGSGALVILDRNQ